MPQKGTVGEWVGVAAPEGWCHPHQPWLPAFVLVFPPPSVTAWYLLAGGLATSRCWHELVLAWEGCPWCMRLLSASKPPLVGSFGLCRGCLAGGGYLWPPWWGRHVDVPVVPAGPALPLRGSWNLENTHTPRPWLVMDLHGMCGTLSPGVAMLSETLSVLVLGTSTLRDRRPRSPTVTCGPRSPWCGPCLAEEVAHAVPV